MLQNAMMGEWELTEVFSPSIMTGVQTVAAKDVPYLPHGNRLQTLSIYLPVNSSTLPLVGSSVTSLPLAESKAAVPRTQVHIHGGAWRDPNLLALSIEAAVAHAYSDEGAMILDAIISLNYTLSPFPSHPTAPYDPVKNNHSDRARDAVHPQHIQDVLHAFAFLSSLGLGDDSYILTGHSAGSCLAFQSALFPAKYWGMPASFPEIPRPAALLGMNGLYGIPELVHDLGDTHEQLEGVYQDLLQIAFGSESVSWKSASPAHIGIELLTRRFSDNRMPKLIVVDQSVDDQLVPMNQMVLMKSTLEKVPGLTVVQGYRCVGMHAAPWEQGYMIVENVRDVLALLAQY